MDWTTIISAAIAAISAGGGIGIFSTASTRNGRPSWPMSPPYRRSGKNCSSDRKKSG